MAFVREPESQTGESGLDGDELDAFYHRPERRGWTETLFTGATAILFLILLAAAATGAFLYTRS